MEHSEFPLFAKSVPGLQVNISVAIVAMINHTHAVLEEHSHGGDGHGNSHNVEAFNASGDVCYDPASGEHHTGEVAHSEVRSMGHPLK